MPVSEARPFQETTGIIRAIDFAGREITLRINGAERVFDVPPDCPVLLHGERVKLRLLQPADRARIEYAQQGQGFVARLIEVDGWDD